jgi:hypothetical protein
MIEDPLDDAIKLKFSLAEGINPTIKSKIFFK